MEPSLRYTTKRNSFFTNHGERPIGGGIVLWRGYFQSLRPAIERLLINVDTATGTMYRSGKLIDIALQFLGKETPNALAPQRGAQRGLPDRERLRLQQFLSGVKVTTPYRTRDPDKRRFVKKVTRESARERTFEIGDGETMTVAEYFQNQLNIPLQFPDILCVEVCTTLILSVCISSRPTALNRCRHPDGALPGTAGTAGP
jgi:eukaryotic translation initiation factor 2C